MEVIWTMSDVSFHRFEPLFCVPSSFRIPVAPV